MVTTMYNNLRYELGGASLEGLIFGILRYFDERNAGVKKKIIIKVDFLLLKSRQCNQRCVPLGVSRTYCLIPRMLGTRLLVSWLFSVPGRLLKTF